MAEGRIRVRNKVTGETGTMVRGQADSWLPDASPTPATKAHPFKLVDRVAAQAPALLGGVGLVPPQMSEAAGGVLGGVSGGLATRNLTGASVGAGLGAVGGRALGNVRQGIPNTAEDLVKTGVSTAGLTALGGGVTGAMYKLPFGMAKTLPGRTLASGVGGATTGAVAAPPGERLQGAWRGFKTAALMQTGAEGVGAGFRFANRHNPFKPPKFDINKTYTDQELAKLPEIDRTAYFNKQQAALDEQVQLARTEAEAHKMADIDTAKLSRTQTLEALQQEATNLELSLQGTAQMPGRLQQRVVEGRAKIVPMLKTESDAFLTKARAKIITDGNPPVPLADLSERWATEFVDDPEGQAVAGRLFAKLRRQFGDAAPATNIFDAYRGEKWAVRTGVRGGGNFSHEDAIHNKLAKGLLDHMGAAGADVTEVLNDYAQYAPVRNWAIDTFGLTKNAQANLDKAAGALESAARNRPVDDARMVKELEKRLGVSLTDDMVDDFLQLDELKQAQVLANAEDLAAMPKLQAERAKEDIAARFLEPKRQLAARKQQVTRRAFERAYPWKRLKEAAHLGGLGLIGAGLWKVGRRMAQPNRVTH